MSVLSRLSLHDASHRRGTPVLALPALVASADERGQRRFLEFFPLRSAMRIRAVPMRAGPVSFSASVTHAASHRSQVCSRCMSRPGSSNSVAKSVCQSSSSDLPVGICLTDWSLGRLSRRTRPSRCGGLHTAFGAARRRCSRPTRRGAC
jgi:hypothetical protein